MGRRSTKSSPTTGAAPSFDTVGMTILPGRALPEWAEQREDPEAFAAPELIADAGPVQDMAVDAIPESPATTEWAATSEALQVPAQGAAPAPQHVSEPAFAMAGAAMVGAAVGTVEAPTAYGQSPTGYGEAPTPYGQAPTGYGPPPAGYGPPAPASSPAAPAYMPEPSRYPAAPTAGLLAPAAAPSSTMAAPATHLAPPAPRLPADAAMPSPSEPVQGMPAGPSGMAANGGPVAATASGQTLEASGHSVADTGLASPPARPGTPQAPAAVGSVDQEAVPPSQAFSSQERESLSPQHIALLSWWADMMAAGQFPVPASAAGPDGTATGEASDGGRTRHFPVKAAALSLAAVVALAAAAAAGSVLNLGI